MKPTNVADFPVTGEYLLSIRGVEAKVDLGKTTLMAMVKAGTFPQPAQIGALLRWRGADVDGWIREQFRALGQAS